VDLDFSQALTRLQAMLQYFVRLLPGLVLGGVVFFIFYFVGKALRATVRRFASERRKHRNVGLVLGRVAQGVTVALGVLVAVTVAFPTFTPANLVQVLGVGSVAIGFAFRDILQNYLAGILLLLTEPFRIGDQIIYDKYEGTVEDIQTRATFITTYDGRRVVIPNSNLFTNSVTVNTAHPTRRIEYDVGIGYGDDVGTARRLILEALREQPEALDDPAPEAFVVDLAESSVNIRARWWIRPPRIGDVFDAKDKVLEAVKSKLQAAGIDLPFPTRQVLVHDQTEETDGDRRRQREGWPAGRDGGDVPRPRQVAAAIGRASEAAGAGEAGGPGGGRGR
jgi:small-conductance mechanosensitive channel